MDEDYRMLHYNKCIDDHEGRLREIEANNKEQAKLYYEREKLDTKIDALATLIDNRLDSINAKNDLRFVPLEKWMEVRISQITLEKGNKKDTKSDLFSVIAVCISVAVLIISLIRG